MTSCGTFYKLAVEESRLSFTSKPNHATITLKGYKPCQTPCVIKVDPVKARRIRAHLDGYDEETKWADTRISFPVFANVLLGFPLLGVGLIVDWASDSLMTWSETHFHFKLDPTKPNTVDEDEEDDQEAPEEEEENQEAESQDESPSAPKPPTPTTTPKSMTPAPPPKTDSKSAPIERQVPESFVNQVRDEIPKSDMDHLIEQYYGKVSESSQKKIEARLMKQLFEMRQRGEALDLDEAVRRDRFEQNETSRRN